MPFSKNLHFLILEDEPDDVELVIMTLERSGINFSVALASDRESFLHAIRNNTFSAILADNSLPQFNAMEALDILSLNGIDVPFVLVTGSISEEFAVEIMKQGAWDYILKDRLNRLPNAVLSAISKYRLQKERQENIENVIRNAAIMREAERLAKFGSSEHDLLYNTHRWSDEFFRILGYEPGEVEPSFENYLQCIHPEDRSKVRRLMEKAYAEADREAYTCRLLGRGDQIKFVECELAIRRDKAGNAKRANSLIKDVTEARTTVDLLQKSEANLKTIFNNTDTGYVLLDTGFRVVSFNSLVDRFAREQLGRAIVEGAYAIDYFENDRQPMVKLALNEALEGRSTSYEVPYPQSNGTNKWFLASYSPVFREGEPLGVIMAQQDITPRKVMELKERMITNDLLQRKNELEQFTYIVSHNLRAPVANILGITYLLKKHNFKMEDFEVLIEGMCTSVEKLDSIIVDLNHIIQAKESNAELKETVVLNELVTDAVNGLPGDLTGIAEVNCRFSEVGHLHTVRSYLLNIFSNLISNSIKYRNPSAPLHINFESRKTDDGIELRICDNGLGIDLSRNRDQVFGLYRRFHPAVAEGKGMGLFMVKTQVESLGGRITINSELEKGTEFIIRFTEPEYYLRTIIAE